MIEKHVTSLALSKRLKELGVKQESEFYWSDGGEIHTEQEYLDFEEYASSVGLHQNSSIQEHFSAFLSSELGEMLPGFTSGKIGMDGEYHCGDPASCNRDYFEFSETEPNVRAKMLIHLIENSIIDVKSL